MAKNRRYLIITLGVITILLLVAVIVLQLVRWHQQSVAAAYRKKMQDPVYRMLQTTKLQPSVERELAEAYPRVTIKPHRRGKQIIPKVYEVHLPPDEGRKLPFLRVDMARIARKYRKQGYQGTLLLYDGDRIIQSIALE